MLVGAFIGLFIQDRYLCYVTQHEAEHQLLAVYLSPALTSCY